MQTIKYKFADGTEKEIEVDDELYKEIEKLDKAEKSNNRAQTRRHISLDEMRELGKEPAVCDEYDRGEMFGDIKNEELSEALRSLDRKQKDLIYRVFYERRRLKEIAVEENVSPQTISWRLNTILSRLRLNR